MYMAAEFMKDLTKQQAILLLLIRELYTISNIIIACDIVKKG